jgi:hypothetical protein
VGRSRSHSIRSPQNDRPTVVGIEPSVSTVALDEPVGNELSSYSRLRNSAGRSGGVDQALRRRWPPPTGRGVCHRPYAHRWHKASTSSVLQSVRWDRLTLALITGGGRACHESMLSSGMMTTPTLG